MKKKKMKKKMVKKKKRKMKKIKKMGKKIEKMMMIINLSLNQLRIEWNYWIIFLNF
jgi:hypothetical protein